ncbi:MAG: hypothetical protein KDA72_09770 [Planctomycetales bacterium]|nr:hypothetical protein [Planctomycetales bacterium]
MNSENISQAADVWADRFVRFQAANMSVAQFCNAEGVTQARYYYWRSKLHGSQSAAQRKPAQAAPQFLPVSLAALAQPKPATVMAVELPGGIRIRFEVTGNFDFAADRQEERA